jgi:hypothetical protein
MTSLDLDVAVLGGGLTAVLAAALVAREGRRVALLPCGELGRPTFLDDLPPAAPTGPARRVLDTLALTVEAEAAARPVQLIFADHRLELPDAPDAALLELGLVAPSANGAALEPLRAGMERLARLLADERAPLRRGLFEAQRRRAEAARLGLDAPAARVAPEALGLLELLAALTPWLCQEPTGSAARIATMPASASLSALTRATTSPAKGLRARVLACALERGLSLMEQPPSALVEHRDGLELRLAPHAPDRGAPERVRAAAVIDGSEAHLSLALSGARRRARASRTQSALRGLEVTVDRDALPAPLGPRALLVEDPALGPLGLALDPQELGTRRTLRLFGPPGETGIELDATLRRLGRLFPFFPEGRPEARVLEGDERPLAPVFGAPARPAAPSIVGAHRRLSLVGPAAGRGLGVDAPYALASAAAVWVEETLGAAGLTRS